jgi:hypothetical protein
MEALGIVTELTGQRKNRCFSYAAYVELLANGPQPESTAEARTP